MFHNARCLRTALGVGLLGATLHGLALPAVAETFDQDYKNPPSKAQTHVWWHWMGVYVSKEGITKDLEAMAASGVGGATIFNLHSPLRPSPSSPKTAKPWSGNAYRSPEWWALIAHAAKEADRLGLNLGMHNCVGYSASGGPWITPEHSMQKVVWSETKVDGGRPFNGPLTVPETNWGFYRDIAVIAVPDSPEAGAITTAESVLDLTARMQPDGNFQWEAPAGRWIVYRFGYTPTKSTAHPAPEGVFARECDKLSAEAGELHIRHVIDPLREHLGPLLGKSLRHLTFDSYEAGPQDWTALFAQEFEKRRGYSPLPWLPVLAKRTLGSEETSKRFLWDMKATACELFNENNFALFRRRINEAGLEMVLEPYGNGPINATAATVIPDIPMGVIWTDGAVLKNNSTRSGIAAVANAHGQNLVAVEAFTGWPEHSKWSETPGFLKATGDAALCMGYNQFHLHSWVHQPFDDSIRPGIVMRHWGTHFGRFQTWYEPGKSWFAYLNRCQALLQRGEVVSDYLALDHTKPHADTIPNQTLLEGAAVKNGKIVLASGRSYAFLAVNKTEMLPEVARKLRDLAAQGATIVGPRPLKSPSLQNYPACDAEVAAIAGELWGPPDSSAKDRHYGNGRVMDVTPEKALATLGIAPAFSRSPQKGKVWFAHRRDADADVFFIANLDKIPAQFVGSFRVGGKIPELWDAVRGTQTDAGQWNETNGRTEVNLALDSEESVFVVFRRSSAAADPVKMVALDGEPFEEAKLVSGSAGTILRTARPGNYQLTTASGKSASIAVPPPPAAMTLEGPWDVSFKPPAGIAKTLRFDKLASWTESPDEGIRYFSGTAHYVRELEVPSQWLEPGLRVELDLGVVRDMAEVILNGQPVAICWTAPFRVDLTGSIKAGHNRLEIAVTNTWANRLIGDQQQPEDCNWTAQGQLEHFPAWILESLPRPTRREAFAAWNYFKKDSPLREAGLLGPVVLRPSLERTIPKSF